MDLADRQQRTAAAIRSQRTLLAKATVTDQYERHPERAQRYGPAGRARCEADAAYHLAYLAEALAAASPALFVEYLGWAKVLLANLHIPVEDLVDQMESLRRSMVQLLPPELAATACDYLDTAAHHLPQQPTDVDPFLDHNAPLGKEAAEYLAALLDGNREDALRIVNAAIDAGHGVRDIYLQIFQRTQHEIGRLWQTNRITVAQEHYCTAATQLIMSSLYPRIFGSPKIGRTLVVACVENELHEIGARIVADFFEIEGWDTWYLGANTPATGVVDTLVRRQAAVLGISATMTFHLPAVADLIGSVRATPACGRVFILVGGYPFNIDYKLWQRIGADGSAHDAGSAVALANELVSGTAGT